MGLANDCKDGYAYIYFIYCFDYRKWSIKHRGAYFIIPVIGVVLISTTGKTLRGI